MDHGLFNRADQPAVRRVDSWLRHRSKLAKHGGGSGALQQEVEDLRVRLEALETIVTNPDFDLKRQIDALEAPRRRSLG